jgi:putative nucleotidyltransferase with HDIG domain
MTRLSLKDIVQKADEFPLLPRLAIELHKELGDETTDVRRVACLLTVEQAIAARALRLANSPFYGVSRPIGSIHEAVMLLGLDSVHAIVVAAAVAAFCHGRALSRFDRMAFLRHGITAASCGRALAPELGVRVDVAFTAALLHDIGTLAIATCLPAQYAAVMARGPQQDGEWSAAERQVLGFDHAELGAALAQRWNFDPAMQAAIRQHHSESRTLLGDIVHTADEVAHQLQGLASSGTRTANGEEFAARFAPRRISMERVVKETVSTARLMLSLLEN